MTKSDCQSLTFLVQTLLLIQDNQFTVLVSLLQHLLTLVNVAVVVLQTKEGGHQRHVGLQGEQRRGERRREEERGAQGEKEQIIHDCPAFLTCNFVLDLFNDHFCLFALWSVFYFNKND